MNIYKIINLEEETFVKLKIDSEFDVVNTTNERITSFELDRLNVIRKAYSYSILNRYVLTNKELIKWFNTSDKGGEFIEIKEEDIQSDDKVMTVNLILQGDTGFFEGIKTNVYSEIENIDPFGIEELNNIIFEKLSLMKKSIILFILLTVGAISILKFQNYMVPTLIGLIIIGFFVDFKLRTKKRIKRFIAFNQKRLDFWKEWQEEITGKESVELKYSEKGGKGYIETINPNKKCMKGITY